MRRHLYGPKVTSSPFYIVVSYTCVVSFFNPTTNSKSSAVVSAYKKRVQRIGSIADAKLNIDIKFAYNIAFEMCRVEGSIMRTRDKGLERLCFAGLGCLYRAAVDLDEMCPGGATPGDANQLRENLEWFSGRWKVAGKLQG